MPSTAMGSFMDIKVIAIVEVQATYAEIIAKPSSYLQVANATNLSPKISTLMFAKMEH
jgi:energy-converting hydrogenase Eha subunit C